jgi:hypothetical protein
MSFCVRLTLVLIFWGMPVAAFSCNGVQTPAYADVTQIYVGTDGLTVPVAIDAATPLDAGLCPQARDVRVWQQGVAMTGDRCTRLRSGESTLCCPGTFATDDPPAQIFARLLTVLERDRFYDVAVDRTSTPAQKGAVFEVAVVRCAPLLAASDVFGPPKPSSQTTILRIVVPVGTKPGTVLSPAAVRLLDDVTNAVYQSKWYGQNVY